MKTDITVVGGGLSGICAAIAAARLGQTVALIQNRPVLGGNSSSEVRVWVCGATGHGVNRYARETGVIGELILENQYQNPDGNPFYWDLVVLEAVRAESKIQWINHKPSPSEQENEQLTENMLAHHKQFQGIYGYRRHTVQLCRQTGKPINHKRIQRLMKLAGIQSVIRHLAELQETAGGRERDP